MSNKIQLISSYGKFHEYNFLRVVLPDDQITVYSDTGYDKPESQEIRDYYDNHGVSLIKAKSFSNIKIKVLRRFLNLISGISIIIKSRKEPYDYCFIHYLSTRRAILSFFLPKRRKQILITYGTDILRRKNFNEFFFRKMVNRSSLIVFNSGNLRYRFEEYYGKQFDYKTIDIPFPCASFKRLDYNLGIISREQAKIELGLPNDKIIIVCGHTSTSDERHDKLIDSFLSIPHSILNQCFFVFPMTYGSGNYLEYRERIKEKLSTVDFQYKVLEEYMPYDQMCKVHAISDIHITGITTDALSLFLLEELYAGAHVIYGKWLHYIEFEQNALGVDSYNDFSDLPEVLIKVIEGKGSCPPKNQKAIIEQLQSNETIKQKWDTFFNLNKEEQYEK